MLIGSHNSFTYLKPRKWWMRLFTIFAKCQSENIIKQYSDSLSVREIANMLNKPYQAVSSKVGYYKKYKIQRRKQNMEKDYRLTKLHGTLLGDNRIPDLPDSEKTKILSSTNGKTAWENLPNVPTITFED